MLNLAPPGMLMVATRDPDRGKRAFGAEPSYSIVSSGFTLLIGLRLWLLSRL